MPRYPVFTRFLQFMLVPALAISALAARATAQSAPAALTPAVRNAVLDSALARVSGSYVDADTARLIVAAVRARRAAGAYDTVTNPAALSEMVTNDLRAVNGDLHLGLRYSPPTGPIATSGLPSDPRQVNFGMGRAEILDGNVGYLEITGFVGGQYRDAVVDALRFLSRTDAMIIDVRRNPGGASDMSHFIFSHFLGAEPVPTIEVRTRYTQTPRAGMSLGEVPGPRRADVPLYVLTSQGTASAAEEFTFVLKNRRRATIVGSRTAGAGHMVGQYPVGNGFVVSASISRVSEPGTGREWERVGVQPDIAVSPERALNTAHAAALRAVVALNPGESRARVLTRLLETVEARGRAAPTDMQRLARFGGRYGTRTISARDGQLWYERYEGAMADALVPLSDNVFALGSTRITLVEASGTVTLKIETADGTTLTIPRDRAK